MKNILKVKTLSKLSVDIYQDDNCIKDVKTANEIIKFLQDNLSKVYKFIETIDENDVVDAYGDLSINRLRDGFDLYQIGDVINLLDSMEVQPENPEEDRDNLMILPFF